MDQTCWQWEVQSVILQGMLILAYPEEEWEPWKWLWGSGLLFDLAEDFRFVITDCCLADAGNCSRTFNGIAVLADAFIFDKLKVQRLHPT